MTALKEEAYQFMPACPNPSLRVNFDEIPDLLVMYLTLAPM